MKRGWRFSIHLGREMRRLRIVGAVLLSIAGLVSAASAADLPARMVTKAPPMDPPVYSWAGFYIGLNGGGASSRECFTITADNGRPVTQRSEGCHNATGALAGGQIGYRWQTTNWVFGVEAQGDWANLKGSNSSLVAIIPFINQTKIDGIGLFTGQVGYAWNNVLVYAKGGAAVTHNNYSSFFPVGNIFAAAGVPFNLASDARWGGTAGGGIEWGFAPNWSVAFEYNHLFMGNPNVTFPPTSIAVGRSDNIRQDVDMGTVRVNYRFGGPIVARY
jgi:outer membrane immunogenic protein